MPPPPPPPPVPTPMHTQLTPFPHLYNYIDYSSLLFCSLLKLWLVIAFSKLAHLCNNNNHLELSSLVIIQVPSSVMWELHILLRP